MANFVALVLACPELKLLYVRKLIVAPASFVRRVTVNA